MANNRCAGGKLWLGLPNSVGVSVFDYRWIKPTHTVFLKLFMRHLGIHKTFLSEWICTLIHTQILTHMLGMLYLWQNVLFGKDFICYFTLQMMSISAVTLHRAIQNQETNCLFFPSSTS